MFKRNPNLTLLHPTGIRNNDSSELAALVTRLFGQPHLAKLPRANPMADSSQAFADLLTDLGDAPVVLFPDIAPGRLDDFFHLRLTQRLLNKAPLLSLSVVVLSPDPQVRTLAGGFADRFRHSWPFARCVFVTAGADAAPALTAETGMPVTQLDDPARPPEIVQSATVANQQIALHIQPIWGRCGSTTAFQNQIEELVRAGYFTLRLFADRDPRRGATLTARIDRLIPENSLDAGAHIDAVAVPDGPPPLPFPTDQDIAWANHLAEQAGCVIADPAVTQAAAYASSVISNHLGSIGLALRLAPKAKLLLDVHDDIAAAYRQNVLMNGGTEDEAEAVAAAAERTQARVLAIPDVCTHVSMTERKRLRLLSQRTAVILPRPYVRSIPAESPARFDVLIVGDEHVFNVQSLVWFLNNVWRPYLLPAGVRVAVAGRVGARINVSGDVSGLLHLAGFVEDLDSFRSSCRLTVVPDRGGSGVPVKMLTTLAAGHPVATTPMGLRGLDPAVAALLPAFDDAEELAADILGLLADEAELQQRRDLVRHVQTAIRHGPTYVNCLAAIPRPTRLQREDRAAQWAAVVAPARRADPGPYHFVLGVRLPMSGTIWDDKVLMDGWHSPEDWGRWMDGADASFRVTLPEPASIPLGLELDINPSPVGALLTVTIEDHELPPLQPEVGSNILVIGPGLIAGRSTFVVKLHASEAFCPADAGTAPDPRVLGVGFRAIRLVSRAPTVLTAGQQLRVSEGTLPWDLLVSGWHPAEDWGCWTNGTDATLRINFGSPLAGAFCLDLDIAPTPIATTLTLLVNGVALPSRVPDRGLNKWVLPLAATDGFSRLSIQLQVAETFCPAASGQSDDDRILGVGIRSISLHPIDTTPCQINETMRIGRGRRMPAVLHAGWHKLEDWGCWTSETEAVIGLDFEEPLEGLFVLELDVAPPLLGQPVTVVVNETDLGTKTVSNGINHWVIPPACSARQTLFLVRLRVDTVVRPSDIKASPDGRPLGVGVRSIGVHSL